jgi:putative flippase GtrA
MLIRALELNIDIIELPIETIYDSKENHTSHFRPIADSIRIYRVFGFAFGKFMLSSFSSSLVDLALFHVLCLLLRQNTASVRYVALATVLARVISAIYNYSVNYYFVFNSKQKHTKSSVKYFLLASAQMACSAALTTGLIVLTGVQVELMIKIPVDIILFLFSYHIQKKFIY